MVDTREYLRNRFAANPSEITQFLSAFSGTAWGSSSGVPRPGDLDRSNYDSICKLVDPRELTDLLVAKYGAELKVDEYERFSDRPVEIRLASQFVYLHRHIRAASEKKEPGAVAKPTAVPPPAKAAAKAPEKKASATPKTKAKGSAKPTVKATQAQKSARKTATKPKKK